MVRVGLTLTAAPATAEFVAQVVNQAAAVNQQLVECLFVGVDLCLSTTFGTAANPLKEETSPDEKEQLADFLRMAGDLAVKRTAFPQALRYYEAVLACLEHKGWEENHEYFLAVTSGAAEAAHCSGNHASLEKHLASILGRDLTLNEKMRAYMMRIKSYGEKEQFQNAIETAV